MGNGAMDTEDFDTIIKALSEFVETLETIQGKMSQAAADCSANLSQDALSSKAISQLQDSCADLKKTRHEAEELIGRVSKAKNEVEGLSL